MKFTHRKSEQFNFRESIDDNDGEIVNDGTLKTKEMAKWMGASAIWRDQLIPTILERKTI